ncbi:unnamed protein product [Acanthoscelides obtectus]|uniref:Uncharacterized protein n=1 Tax=Acanthoscelides obtectus TaxID=200917 RepID=A0A9P0Q492_ACAOB|nr:unnamed protein product [Acanthoscelides obtectus]CAK1638563.1 hypothetical protein AOBTE_LOCUS10667 [Acanthoscelides obtectus]
MCREVPWDRICARKWFAWDSSLALASK